MCVGMQVDLFPLHYLMWSMNHVIQGENIFQLMSLSKSQECNASKERNYSINTLNKTMYVQLLDFLVKSFACIILFSLVIIEFS